MGGKGNNPSLRLVEYERETGSIVNINQYWSNLTLANLQGTAKWVLEYAATDYYGIENMDGNSLEALVQSMKLDRDLFDKYYSANGVQFDPNEEWDADTQNVHICAIQNLHYADFALCMQEANRAGSHDPSALVFLSAVLLSAFSLSYIT